MKLDAIKHKGKSLSQVATKSDSAAEVGAAMGGSRDMVFRYIRLTDLVPPLLDTRNFETRKEYDYGKVHH